MARLRTLFAAGAAAAAGLAAPPAMADILMDEPLPRIESALCPGVMGLTTESALTIIDRLRENAGKVGVTLANPETCKPNLILAVVGDGREAVDQLMESQPRLFDSLTAAEKRELRTASGPVRAWNVVTTSTRDGLSVGNRENMATIPQATMWNAHSKIYVPTRKDIVSSVVLYDAGGIKGATLAQLADYASMRAFAADFSPYEEDDGESILALFDDPGDAPDGLTATDLTFLRSLYSGPANLPGKSKTRSIENDIASR